MIEIRRSASKWRTPAVLATKADFLRPRLSNTQQFGHEEHISFA